MSSNLKKKPDTNRDISTKFPKISGNQAKSNLSNLNGYLAKTLTTPFNSTMNYPPQRAPQIELTDNSSKQYFSGPTENYLNGTTKSNSIRPILN